MSATTGKTTDSARAAILAKIRRGLKRAGPVDGATAASLRTRIDGHARNLVPQRGQGSAEARTKLFVDMARELAATVDSVKSLADVPEAIASYLARENLPARLRVAPDPQLDAIPWASRPMLQIAKGRAAADDLVSVTGAFGAIAESGTLMLVSGPDSPTTLNFLPDTHVVVLPKRKVAGFMEEAWDRLRRAKGNLAAGAMPRTVNFISGPSRSGDIEQTLLMGAHGPRRLHIVVVEDDGRGDDPLA